MSDDSQMTKAAPGTAGIVREGFGEVSVEKRHETAATSMAAQAQAEITARYIVARQNPRDADVVRTQLLKESSRPNFARRAFYSVPRGDKPGRLTGTPGRIEGLSVRFAESAIRVSGNILQATRTLYDDDYKRMINVAATDLETNAVYARDIVIEKTVERAKPKDKAVILGQRTNSAGNTVYIVQATEDELLQKEGALISKTFRTLALRLVPPDVLEECEQRIVLTIEDENAKDPDAARKLLCDAFFKLGISPDELKEYVGHGLEQFSKQEKLDLTGLHQAIKDGEISWADAMRSRVETRDKPPGEEPKRSRAAEVAEKVKSRQREPGED